MCRTAISNNMMARLSFSQKECQRVQDSGSESDVEHGLGDGSPLEYVQGALVLLQPEDLHAQLLHVQVPPGHGGGQRHGPLVGERVDLGAEDDQLLGEDLLGADAEKKKNIINNNNKKKRFRSKTCNNNNSYYTQSSLIAHADYELSRRDFLGGSLFSGGARRKF